MTLFLYQTSRINSNILSDTIVKWCVFEYCRDTSVMGGALYINCPVTCSIQECVFSHGYSDASGAFRLQLTSCEVNRTCFNDNSHFETQFKGGVVFHIDASSDTAMADVAAYHGYGIGDLHVFASPLLTFRSNNFTRGVSSSGASGITTGAPSHQTSFDAARCILVDSECLHLNYLNHAFPSVAFARGALVNNTGGSTLSYCFRMYASVTGTFSENVVRKNRHAQFVFGGVTVTGNWFDYDHDAFTTDGGNYQIDGENTLYDVAVGISCFAHFFTSAKLHKMSLFICIMELMLLK